MDDGKYDKINSLITIITLIIAAILGAIFNIRDLNFSFSAIVAVVSIALKIIDFVARQPKWKKIAAFANYSLLLFLLGGLIIFDLGMFVQLKKLDQSLTLYLIITIPAVVIVTIVFFIIKYAINLDEENDELKQKHEAKEKEFNNRLRSIEVNTGLLLKRSGITKFNDLLKIIEEKRANVLTVTGNLLGLKTIEGCNLLKQFLEGSSSNKVHLVIPVSSIVYLKELKNNVAQNNLLDRIKVSIYERLWFLQGIVIIGRFQKGFTYEMEPIGFFYYKIKATISDDMPDEGIYVDLDNFERLDEHREAVSAYYFLLETLKYSRDPFEVEKVFKKNGINYNSKIIKTVDWSTV